MLTLKNFEQQVHTNMLEKGRQYFFAGAVVSLEETETDQWQAQIEGNELYETEVHLKNSNEIIDYSCTCPYDGGLCKHAVAAFFAIRQERGKAAQANAGSSKKEVFETVLQKIALAEYQDFIRHYAAGHKSFKTEFELWFAAKDERINVGKNYEALIKKIIRKHEDRGFIEYRATRSLANEMDTLLDTGFEQIKKKNFRDAFALAKAALKEMVPVFSYSDDSDGNIGGTVAEATRLLETIIDDREAAMACKEEIYEFLEAELNDKTYFDYGDTGFELFELFRRLAVMLNKQESFLSFIDKKLPTLTGQYDDYDRDFFNKQKIKFLKETGQAGEAAKLVQQNLDIVEVRQGEVDKAVTKKDFGTARKLVADGIRIAEKKGHPGTVSQWEKELLRMAVLEKDVGAVRRYTKHFAFDMGFSKDYYHQWKKTYQAEEWEKVIEEWIEGKIEQMKRDEAKKSGAWYASRPSLLYALAPVYIEEKYWDRLLALVAEANNFDTAWHYHDYLVKTYPLELLQLYLPAIEQKGDKVSQRTEYADLARKMKKISKDIPAGKEKIMAIAQRLKEKYPRRPAMVEELNKILK